MKITNVVFDIDNVLVKWDPKKVVSLTFPEVKDVINFTDKIIESQIWKDLRLGKVTEREAINRLSKEFDIRTNIFEEFMRHLKVTQVPIPGSIELLDKVYNKGFHLYALTNNIKEVISYFQSRYDFLSYFIGVVSSSDIGVLKPTKEIYKHLLDTYELNPHETIFIDDLDKNIDGAKEVGINAIKFTNANECIKELKKFGIEIAE
jgi:putative hydrolase of the HAD superfamily